MFKTRNLKSTVRELNLCLHKIIIPSCFFRLDLQQNNLNMKETIRQVIEHEAKAISNIPVEADFIKAIKII